MVSKSDLREKILDLYFKGRRNKASKEYTDAVEDTPYKGMSVIYKNKILNPYNRKPSKSGFYEVPEDSEHAKKLDRLIRVINEIDTATKHLTYILNFIEHEEEFNYLLNLSDKKLEPMIQAKLDHFKETNKKMFTSLNKFKLLSEII